MTNPSSGNFNPYQAPTSAGYPTSGGYGGVDLSLLKRFRREMHGLGGFWILIGGVVTAAFIIVMATDQLDELGLPGIWTWIVLAECVLYLVVGICTCLKQMWAVWLGLVLSYLSLVGSLLQVALGVPRTAVCGIVVMIIVIVQAHRCIKYAAQLTAAGVPLTARPDDYLGGAPPGTF